MCTEFKLTEVVGPLILEKGSGVNDDLNGSETPPLSFVSNNREYEVVQSLAKWKRLYLAQNPNSTGIIVNMTAIRPSETISSLHDITVRQWDWEAVITGRKLDTLHSFVSRIYKILRSFKSDLPEHIKFLTTTSLYS